MKYPVWFPYPTSWIRALISLIWITIFLFFSWLFGSWSFMIGATTNRDKPSSWVIWLGVFCFILAFSVFYESLESLIQRRKLKRFNALSLRNLWEGLFCLIVIIATLANTVVMAFPILDLNRQEFGGIVYYHRISNFQVMLIFVSMWITSAYLYQVEYLSRKYLLNFKKNSPALRIHLPQSLKEKQFFVKRTSKSKAIDPVELELNRMKGELGLTNMKSVRSTPGSRAGSKPVSKPASKPAPKPSKRQS